MSGRRKHLRFEVLEVLLGTDRENLMTTADICVALDTTVKTTTLDSLRMDRLVTGNPVGGKLCGTEKRGIPMEWRIRERGKKAVAKWLDAQSR